MAKTFAFHSLTKDTVQAYLILTHSGYGRVTYFEVINEYLQDATPTITASFTIDNGACQTGDFWLELQDSGERHVYGEW